METSARESPQAQGEGSVKTGKMLLEVGVMLPEYVTHDRSQQKNKKRRDRFSLKPPERPRLTKDRSLASRNPTLFSWKLLSFW